MGNRERWARHYLLTGMMPVMLVASLLTLVSVGFWIGIPLGAGHFVLAALGVFSLTFWLANRLDIHPIRAYLAGTVLFIGAIAFTNPYFDTTYDGQWYHQEATLRLANGWNPVEEEVGKLTLDHYTKAPWINGAALYLLTGKIESVKAFNFIWMGVAAILVAGTLLIATRIPHLVCLLIGIAIAAAPLSLYQSMSFYIDGQLASWTIILAAWGLLLVVLTEKERGTRIALWGLVPIVAVLLNIKFTAIPLLVVWGVLLIAYFLYKRWSLKLKAFVLPLLLSAVLGIVVMGFQPYGTNWMRKGHPLYPFNDAEIVEELLVLQRPASLVGASRIEKLVVSLASAGMISTKDKPIIKQPFRWSEWEIKQFRFPDPRLGGHGPWFSGILVLCLLVLAMGTVTEPRKILPIWGLTAAIFLSALMIAEPWWARYTPQLLLLPVPAMVWAFSRSQWWMKVGGACILAAMMYNSGLVANGYYSYRHQISQRITHQLADLKAVGDSITISTGHKHGLSIRTRMAEHDIPIREVGRDAELPCSEPQALIGCLGKYCLPPADVPQPQ